MYNLGEPAEFRRQRARELVFSHVEEGHAGQCTDLRGYRPRQRGIPMIENCGSRSIGHGKRICLADTDDCCEDPWTNHCRKDAPRQNSGTAKSSYISSPISHLTGVEQTGTELVGGAVLAFPRTAWPRIRRGVGLHITATHRVRDGDAPPTVGGGAGANVDATHKHMHAISIAVG